MGKMTRTMKRNSLCQYRQNLGAVTYSLQKIVILSLNPGYVPQLNKELACMFRANQAENIMADKRSILEMRPQRESLPTKILGDWYWKRSLVYIGKDIYPEDPEKLWMTSHVFKHVLTHL